jgi:hypothetical protein
MPTLNSILKEIKEVPVSRLEEVHQFLQSLSHTTKQSETVRKKILSFGGSLSDMSTKDYSEFLAHTKKVRTKFFDRNIDL